MFESSLIPGVVSFLFTSSNFLMSFVIAPLCPFCTATTVTFE